MKKLDIRPIMSVEELLKLQPWLESFNHSIPKTINGRFHTIHEGERLLAVTQQHQMEVLTPAVNPKEASPRDTYEIAKIFLAWHGNHPHHVSVPSDSHMHPKMAMLGYKPVAVLYEPV
jgi:hypothetical protein